MHILSLPNALLFLLLLMASTAYSVPPAETLTSSPDPTTTPLPPTLSIHSCIVSPRAELFPGMLDQGSRDPKYPRCKIYASVGRANLALCTNAYTPVGEKELELFNKRFPYCWYGSDAWERMMLSCPDGEMVEAIRQYNEEGLLLRIYRNRDRP